MASSWDLTCKSCNLRRSGIATKNDATRHGAAHKRTTNHEPLIAEVKPLSSHPRKGDRIKVKTESIPQLRVDCTAAGYDVNFNAVRVVTRVDDFGTGGRTRLHVEGAPFMFYPSDVALAWKDDRERREGLEL